MLIGLMGTLYTSSPSSVPAGTSLVQVTGSSTGVSSVYVTNPLGSGPIDYTKGDAQEKSYLSPDVTLLATSPPNQTPASNYLPTLYDTFPDGLPILYYRKLPGLPGTTGVPVQPAAGYTNPGSGAFYLNSNEAYFDNSQLTALSGAIYNEQNGTLFKFATNTVALAYEVADPSSIPAPSTATLSNSGPPNTVGTPVRGGFVLISAGPDRIYGPPVSTETSTIGQLTGASAALNDDIIVAGGQ